MRLPGFWILLFLAVAGGAFAQPVVEKQSAALPGASISDSLQTNGQSSFRRIEVVFGDRRIVAERRINEAAGAFPNGFGDASGADPILLNGQAVSLENFRKRLTEPTWLLDSRGEGFYFPAQPDLELVGKAGSVPAFSLQSLDRSGRASTASVWMEFGKISSKDLASAAALMTNPTLAPLQMTENDASALIVYDPLTKTTAYALFEANERMNSEGYLSGAGQPCVGLIRSNSRKLILSGGKTRDVGTLRLKIFGEWTPSPTEAGVLKSEPKAGRTWIEFTAGPEGSEPINLVELPDKGFMRRILELFVK